MSVSPFSRVRVPSLPELKSSAGEAGGESIGDMLGVALADISVKSMAEVAGGVRAGSRKGKGPGGKSAVGVAPQTALPLQPQPTTTKGSEADTLAEKIRQAIEKATVATPVVAHDAFEANAGGEGALGAFAGDTSTPAVASDANAAVKPWALAPTRLKG